MKAPVYRIGGLAEELRVNLNHCRSSRMLDNWISNFRRQMSKLSDEQIEDLAERSVAALRRLCPHESDMAVATFYGAEPRAVKGTSI